MYGYPSDAAGARRFNRLFRLRSPAGAIWAIAITSWASTVLGGFFWLSSYKATVGARAATPVRWPSSTKVGRERGRPTLVMFAHPHCPCTRASVSELARLAAAHPELSARVLFLKPEDVPDAWEQTDLWRSVASIPGAVPLRDDGGREAARFGAMTSGFTILYDADGKLLFSGGITASRGHEGDSFGRRRIGALLRTGSADRRDAPVFGCALPSPASS